MLSSPILMNIHMIFPPLHRYSSLVSHSAIIVAPPGPSFLCFKKNEEAEFENTPSSSDLQHTTDTNAM